MADPYYEAAGVRVYCGDATSIGIDPSEFAVVTDPPYGIRLATNYKTRGRSNKARSGDYPTIHGDDAPFDPRWMLGAKSLILFGANYYAPSLPASGSWLVWDKRDGGTSDDGADCEMAWCRGVLTRTPRLFSHKWRGMIKASERNEKRIHPTQKPVALFEWALGYVAPSLVVYDPYAGSGACLIAAMRLGRLAVGCEIEESYCEAMARRIDAILTGR